MKPSLELAQEDSAITLVSDSVMRLSSFRFIEMTLYASKSITS